MAPLLPKLRGNFAEFLNDASPVGLRILSSPTCVGLRYGRMRHDSGFSRHCFLLLRYFPSLPLACPDCTADFPTVLLTCLARFSLSRVRTWQCVPAFSDRLRYGNLNPLSVGYAFRPRLRSRLTQGRSALPWKPWIFGRKDSHLPLATHSGILSSCASTAPCQYGFADASMLPYQSPSGDSRASVSGFSPGHFRRGTSRLVSYYALFERMAASEPTS